jgi:GTPase SAR1 family protein
MMPANSEVQMDAYGTRYRSIASSYYRGAKGILLVFDLTNRETFDSVPFWKKEIHKYASDSVYVILVGNKCDDPSAP